MSEVLFIHTAPESGAPLQSHAEVRALAGRGLEGDRNLDGNEARQVTIVSTAELADAVAELGYAIEPGSTRRNITISDIKLPRQPGRYIRLGEVTVEITRDCSPCEVMEVWVGPGAREALQVRAGVTGRILADGVIRVGDSVELV